MADAQAIATENEAEDFSDLLSDAGSAVENTTKDLLNGRFRILVNQPLPELSKTLAQAYAVQDIEKAETQAYALIFSNDMPYRMKGIEVQKTAAQPAFLRCYAAGPIPLSAPAETRMVAVLEKPTGRSLKQIVEEKGPLSERFIMDKILRPLNDALRELERAQINHGCINPSQLFLDQELKIAESISMPSGYSQDFHYESPERLLASASGKGSGNSSADAYAVGVLALYLARGELPFKHLEKKEWEETILRMGSYHAFTNNYDPSETLSDLLRGTLNDNPRERWTFEQISAWMDGKRFNLILPSVPHDCSRPYVFEGKEYFSYRALAHALFYNWQVAKTHLSATKLVRWMELNPTSTTAAEAMARVLRVSDSDTNEPALKDEELMKVISILDPYGPMRFKEASVNIDGLGKALAASARENNTQLRQQILTMIETGLPGFISDLLDKSHNSLANKTLWQLQKLRPVLQHKGLGFGVDRLIYTLNASLPCQSQLLKRYHIVSLQELLLQLDRMAREHLKRSSLIDSQLAAFLTSKLEITKELRVLELAGHPDLVLDQRLIMLKLLAQAQQKMNNQPLKGLAVWVAATIMPIAQKLHQKSSRELLIKEIKQATKTGLLGTIAFLVFRDKIFTDDRREFLRVKHLYQYHKDSIVSLQDDKKIKRSAVLMGRKASVTIGYLIVGIAMYFAFDPYMSF